MPIPVLLDVDNAMPVPVADVDDAVALALALASPDIELVGVSACAGNCRVEESVRNTLLLLEKARRADVPVAAGAVETLGPSREPHFACLAEHRRRYAHFWPKGTIEEPSAAPDPRAAHELIVELAARHPGLVLVMCGSLTNLAMALRAEPDLPDRIGRVVHMGGTLPGFVFPTPDMRAEDWIERLRFNTLFDPMATRIVAEAGLPLDVVPADVTTRVLLRPADVEPLRNTAGEFARWLAAGIAPWMAFSMGPRGIDGGAHMHDPLALAAVFGTRLLSFEAGVLDLDAVERGRGDCLAREGRGAVVRIATHVDAKGAEAMIAGRLASLA
jgi:purine nucleosidase